MLFHVIAMIDKGGKVDAGMKSALAMLQGKTCVRITAHDRPDGDALGASLALRRLLAERGVDAKVVGMKPIPLRYRFMVQPGEMIAGKGSWRRGADLICVLDCTTLDRAGNFAQDLAPDVPILNIDHHEGNPKFGAINWVDTEVSCVGEMIYRLARAGEYGISRTAAEAIYVAIVTDTGRFAFENTSAEVLRIGAALIDLGVNPSKIEQEVYQAVSLREMKLAGRATDSLEICAAGRIGIVTLTQEDFEAFNCTPLHSQDVIEIPRRVAGVEVAVFCYALAGSDEIKVSMRSVAPHDVGSICRSFGGGGHARASGCSFANSDMPTVIETVRNAIVTMLA